ncbi:Hypothetical protein YALI2_C00086g [Yarrowia lipolytica]|jgi:hypothetical protein|nr:Hypothetical protein YALI2_C00086g [Yarrowia lipolytica]
MWAKNISFSVKEASRNGFKEAEALTVNSSDAQQKVLNDILLASNTLRQKVEETHVVLSQATPRISGSLEKTVGGMKKPDEQTHVRPSTA